MRKAIKIAFGANNLFNFPPSLVENAASPGAWRCRLFTKNFSTSFQFLFEVFLLLSLELFFNMHEMKLITACEAKF